MQQALGAQLLARDPQDCCNAPRCFPPHRTNPREQNGHREAKVLPELDACSWNTSGSKDVAGAEAGSPPLRAHPCAGAAKPAPSAGTGRRQSSAQSTLGSAQEQEVHFGLCWFSEHITALTHSSDSGEGKGKPALKKSVFRIQEGFTAPSFHTTTAPPRTENDRAFKLKVVVSEKLALVTYSSPTKNAFVRGNFLSEIKASLGSFCNSCPNCPPQSLLSPQTSKRLWVAINANCFK